MPLQKSISKKKANQPRSLFRSIHNVRAGKTALWASFSLSLSLSLRRKKREDMRGETRRLGAGGNEMRRGARSINCRDAEATAPSPTRKVVRAVSYLIFTRTSCKKYKSRCRDQTATSARVSDVWRREQEVERWCGWIELERCLY